MEIQNKLVVITGVSKGIGLCLTQEFLKRGAHVVGLGRSKPDLNNNSFTFIQTNVRSHEEVDRAFETINQTFNQPVDVLVNNAGLGYFGYLEDHTLEQWHQMYETNVNAIYYTSRRAIPGMKSAGSGHIINIASTAGLEGYPQVSGYCGTKFAVKGISQSMYKELRGFGVKVTCVFPGSVKTNFFENSAIEPHDYMLQPIDVASMIIHAVEAPFNAHQVNLEIRPLQPKGPGKS